MNFIGIDVSKKKLDCSLIRAERPDARLHKVVPNTSEGVATLLIWVKNKANCDDISAFHAVLEATGPYHEIAAQALFDTACKVSVVNPAYTKSFAQGLGVKTKTDRTDADTLARYAMLAQPPAWQPTPPQYRQLQTLQARKQALEIDLQRERNRLEKQEATRGEPLVIESIQRMIQHLETERQVLEQAMETHVQAHPDLSRDRELLLSIQGVGPVISTLLLPILQPGRFKDAPQAAAYLGLVPVEHQSGSSVNGRPRLSKAGNATVRAKLYMAAIVAARYNPDVKALYERLLAKGKSKMSALGACMRKLVHICFGVLKHQTVYSPKAA